MGRLVYLSIGSLDGFIADPDGDFQWSAPDEEVHAHINRHEESVVAELYGRRIYEIMQVWQTYGTGPDASDAEREYGEQWRRRDKMVFSTTLADVATDRTRLARHFDAAQIRTFVDGVAGDVSIGGPTLAAQALRAGIVDVVAYYASPIILGAGLPWLPADVRMELALTEHAVFGNGVTFQSYDVVRGTGS